MTRLKLIAAVLSALALSCCSVAPSSGQRIASPRPFRDCDLCPEMVVIPAGTFQMGDDHIEQMQFGEQRSEGPVRTIKIAKPFAAGRFEVTTEEFSRFIDSTGYIPSQRCQMWSDNKYVAGASWRDPGYGRPPLPREPVVCVTWRDAKAYVAWLGKISGHPYRLLSEAEWEYASRGGATSVWPWGEDPALICTHGNILDASGVKEARSVGGRGAAEATVCDDHFTLASPVGAFQPNKYGLFDMLGNVWEWTEDCSVLPYPAGPLDGSPVQVQGDCEKRAIRGGSWRTRLSRQRLTFRGRDPELAASHIFGFRIARDL